jgi:hypothetical protein
MTDNDPRASRPRRPPARSVSGHDAALLRLCQVFLRQHAAALAIPSDDDEALDAAMVAKWDTSDQIQAMRPASRAGTLAKARVTLIMLEENCRDDPQGIAPHVATIRDLIEAG